MSLSTNTTGLQEILEIINNLPEAGGGTGGAKITTGTITVTVSSSGIVAVQHDLGEIPNFIAFYSTTRVNPGLVAFVAKGGQISDGYIYFFTGKDNEENIAITVTSTGDYTEKTNIYPTLIRANDQYINFLSVDTQREMNMHNNTYTWIVGVI